MRRAFVLTASFALSVALVQDSNLPFFELTRDERVTTVQQTASDAEGGIFASRSGCNEEREEDTFTTVYAPNPLKVETQLNDTLITSNIVLREQPPRDQDNATLHMAGGTLQFNVETFCPENIEESSEAEVKIETGRTTVLGVTFDYENATGIGTMTGPIDLDREAEGDSPALQANSEGLKYVEETDQITLTDDVRIESDGRVSEADLVEFDEENGIAVLRGNVTSQKGEETLQGDEMTYFINSNEIRVEGNVAGTLEIDTGEPTTTTSTDAPDEDVADEDFDESESESDELEDGFEDFDE